MENGGMIKSIAFTVYPVSDMVKARHFYEQILGLVPAESFGEFWQEYDVAGATFGIVLMSDHAPECFKGTKGTTIAFEVEDLDKALASIRQQDVPVVEGPNDFPACRMFVMADPDGNLVTFHQITKPH
jgi:predicted enzyme related to lactoylglutathione lyase